MNRALFLLLPIASTASMPCPVLAQSATADAVTLDRVQVTATRLPHPAREAPAAISVVAPDRPPLDGLGATLSEHLDAVPGLLARDRRNYAQDEQVSIRGFGTRASFGIRGVRLFVDGVPATMPDGQGQVSHFPLAGAERIEVLRGPFSALYGNAAGGVVQLFTADGSGPPSVGAFVAAGSHGDQRMVLDARGANGALEWNVAATHFATDGHRAHARAERTAFNAKLTPALRGDNTLTLLVNALESPDAQDPLGLDRDAFLRDPDAVAAGALLFDTRKSVAQRQLGVVFTHRTAGGAEWRAMAYAGRREVEQFLAIPVGTQGNPLSGGGVVDLHSPYAGVDLRWSTDGTLAGRHVEWVVGLAHDRQRQERRGYENFRGDTLGVRGALRLQQEDRVDATDPYAQATWRFADAWSLTAGLRHSRVRFASQDRYVTDRNPDDSGRVAYRATSPVLGVRWRATHALDVYAAYGEGFETPTFNELAYRADGGSGPHFALRPARTRSTEAGLKFGDGPLHGDVAVFRAGTDDELTVATSAGGRTTFRNAGRARRVGAEWSATLPLGERWRLRVALTWIDARFRDGFLACTGTPCARPDTPVPAGTRIPGVPRTTTFLALRRGGERGWHVQFDGRHVAAVPVNQFDDERAPGYAVFGASAGYGFGNASEEGRAFLAIDNLGDRRHAGSVIINEGNRRYYEPARGRSVTVGIAWRWK